MWKLPPDSAAWRAERPIIQAPLARATASDHSTAVRKRPSTSRISCSRWGGSSAQAAGRRQTAAKVDREVCGVRRCQYSQVLGGSDNFHKHNTNRNRDIITKY